MKRYIYFDNNIYNGNLAKDLFNFIFLKKPKIIKYKIKNFIKKIKRKEYDKWEYLKYVDKEKYIDLFWEKKNKRINYDLINKKTIVLGNFPKELIKKLEIKYKQIDIPFVDYVLKSAKPKDEIFYHKYNRKLRKSNLSLKIGKKYHVFGKKYFCNLAIEYLKLVLLMAILSFILSIVSLYFAKANLEIGVFFHYFTSLKLLFLNTFPIFVLFCFLYLVINRFTLSFFITSLLTIILSMINYFKIIFRNEPFTIKDLTLAGEASEMLNTYTLKMPLSLFVIVLLFVILLIFLNKKIKQTIDFPILRIGLIIIIILGSIFSMKVAYTNKGIYKYTPVMPCPSLDLNSTTDTYISKGFIYPFLHSVNDLGIHKPLGYNEEKVKKILAEYPEENIENKVHIISIMLESYSDFSGVGNFVFNEKNVYDFWHELEEKSYNGKIVSSVFGGGTINTERKFLTGLSYFTIEPKKDVNSYVRYFNEQGYYTTGSHPGYSWFYDRISINEHFGFKNYKYFNDTHKTEFKGEDEWDGLASDYFVVKDIIKDYEQAIKDDKYIFNFTVTYQNHGPQRNYYDGETYIEKLDGYADDVFRSLNYYFDGIYKTNEALKHLIEYFENEDEPVVVILFGDHKPELGWGKVGYTAAEINIDTNSKEGFMNYYTSPYVIWGNNSAKNVLDNDLIGEGPNLSSNYLLGEFFELAGYKGPSIMQYSNKLKKSINVIHQDAYEEKGVFTRELSKNNEKKLKEFNNVEYYNYTSYKK